MSEPGRPPRPSGSPGALGGLALAGAVVCCGLPVLLAAGSAVTFLGLGLGSWTLITAGLVAAAAGAFWWRSGPRRCRAADDDTGSREPYQEDRSQPSAEVLQVVDQGLADVVELGHPGRPELVEQVPANPLDVARGSG